MHQLTATTLEELKAHLTPYGVGYLFRGQTNNYPDATGLPILNSSFVRRGCVPPLMLKWIFYVRELLRRGGYDTSSEHADDVVQGLLQHYGWRSFFVDLGSSQTVASWFASHSFSSKQSLDLCENPDEDPVMLLCQKATYTPVEGTGNLFVLSKAGLVAENHNVISLVDELTTDFPTRFQVQKAWQASIFFKQNRLSPKAIVAHITAPSALFQEVAAVGGYITTDHIFTPPSVDHLLKNLLSLPRMKIGEVVTIPVYVRSLEIPEYQDSFVKRLDPTTALSEQFWLSETIPPEEAGLVFRVSESAFYGNAKVGKLSNLAPYLKENPLIHIETNGLICYSFQPGNDSYNKGISIRHSGEGLFEIGSLSIDYFADQLTGAGVSKGYSYKLEDDSFVRVKVLGDCPCGDTERHLHHLKVCAVLDDLLASKKPERAGNILTMPMDY